MDSLLTPVLVLVCLSLVVWFLMIATRVPAMSKLRIPPQEGKHTKDLAAKLPGFTRQISDNYNHLMEQPTIFYALVFYIQLAGHSDALSVKLAWLYVILRILHSVVKCTVNVVMVRFLLFLLSTLTLIVMAGREVIVLLH